MRSSKGSICGVWEISPLSSTSSAPVRLLPKSITMWTCLASPAVAVAGRMQTSTGGTPRKRPLLQVQQPFQANHEILGQRGGLAEVADLGVSAGGVHGQEEPRGAGLDDLPLDVGIGLGGLVFLLRGADAALPAVADLAALVAAAAQRNADELDAGVGE